MDEHVLRLRTRLAGRTSRFWGECSCGWTTEELPSAGIVHGEHGRHLESVDRLTDLSEPGGEGGS